MESIWNYFLENPLMTGIFLLAAGVVIYFAVKKLLKYALISLAVFIALTIFSYYRAPDEFPDKFVKNIEEIHERSSNVAEKGKGAVEQGRRFINLLNRVFGEESDDSEKK